VVEHRLWEGLALSMTSEIGGETERLHDRQVSLNCEHRCLMETKAKGETSSWEGTDDIYPWALLLREYLATATIEHTVDTTDRVLWTLDLHCTRAVVSWDLDQERFATTLTEIDGLLKTWRC
jgi:hypothetical protein